MIEKKELKHRGHRDGTERRKKGITKKTRIAQPHSVGAPRRQDRRYSVGRIREKTHPAANEVSDPAVAFGDDPVFSSFFPRCFSVLSVF